jgi:hypothetical protein
MVLAIGAIYSIKLREQRTTVLMLDFPFQTPFAIATAKRACKLRFQSGETVDLLPNSRQLVVEHGLHFGTNMMLLPQGQQFLNFGEREPQFLGMSHKCKIANLPHVEQAISARAATRTLDESESLICARLMSDKLGHNALTSAAV